MWHLIVHTPDHEPKQIPLKTGKFTIGRASTNQLVLGDISASRNHAEIILDESNALYIFDMDSTNGTFINRQRISGRLRLNANDVIRIGQVVIQVFYKDKTAPKQKPYSHMYTRELLLESLDQHSILLYEVAQKLNLTTNPEMMASELTTIVKNSMGIHTCSLIMREKFHELESTDKGTALILHAIKNCAAEVTPSEMYVPIMLNETEVMGVLRLSKAEPVTRPFDQSDLQVAVAICYQVALTIQRLLLLDQIRKEEQARQLLMRFVSPAEAKLLQDDYLQSGKLPPLRERKVTILFSDIADSTGLGERLGAQHFAEILNKFYADAVDIVFKYHGILKYLGDGIMAIYMDMDTPDALSAEERAALSGRELLRRIKTTGRLDEKYQVVLGVSINTGTAMVGYIGTAERPEFNALGDTVNVAFRMQEYARPNRIVAGPATIAAIVDKYRVQRIGEISIKGREQPIQVYEILP
jgi:class 3 adenylate cyclase